MKWMREHRWDILLWSSVIGIILAFIFLVAPFKIPESASTQWQIAIVVFLALLSTLCVVALWRIDRVDSDKQFAHIKKMLEDQRLEEKQRTPRLGCIAFMTLATTLAMALFITSSFLNTA